jgi:hypothetical protein
VIKRKRVLALNCILVRFLTVVLLRRTHEHEESTEPKQVYSCS